jgi:hypothetical protein
MTKHWLKEPSSPRYLYLYKPKIHTKNIEGSFSFKITTLSRTFYEKIEGSFSLSKKYCIFTLLSGIILDI